MKKKNTVGAIIEEYNPLKGVVEPTEEELVERLTEILFEGFMELKELEAKKKEITRQDR